MKRLARNLFVFGTIASLTVIVLIISGSLNTLSNDGVINPSIATVSIILYWALGSICCWCLSQFKNRWRQILLALSTFIICIAIIEIALRITWPNLALREFEFLRSQSQHHVLMPNTSYHLGILEGRDVIVTTNADGLRSSYSQQQYKNGKQRIVCLGDSFTFGAWVDARDSYPEQLERILNSTKRQECRVLNAGMLSYSPLLHEQLLKRSLMKYRPTVVTLMLDCTDIGDDYHYSQDFDSSRQGGIFVGTTVTKSTPHFGALWRLIKPLQPAILSPLKLVRRLGVDFRAHDPLDYYHFRIPVGDHVESDRFFIYRYPLVKTRRYFDFTYSRITSIARFCKKRDIKFILFVAPRYHHWSTTESPRNWEFGVYGNYKQYQYEWFNYFNEKKMTAEFPIVSLLTEFQETSRYPLVFDSDPHWNEAGNRFVAEAVARALEDRKLIDPTNHK
ncbi:MAG: hypothetical protein CMJ76_10615 [Planctomycetaceae bacterium]|nr:hypothetical protein [Planctomycetaceae bacterium]|tara:strand:- start:245 stop:1588 length:1344 start_codon:yes stop_codon:yes gene_type:complete